MVYNRARVEGGQEMAMNTSATYPARYETEVLLKDGSAIRLRPIKSGDARRWIEFVSRFPLAGNTLLTWPYGRSKITILEPVA